MSEITHPTIVDGWFREISHMWPGQAMTLKVDKVLHHEKSKFQDVLIFDSTNYGRVLVLDNVIQCTERDEFSYQEMITHLAMFAHPSPKRVLVIGGGDGGVLREVVKHEMVEEATLVDIDEAVIRLSKEFLPGMSVGFEDKRCTAIVGDGFEYLKQHKGEYDVIITDSSDPDGPAESLFQASYFELLDGALREGGIITTQGEWRSILGLWWLINANGELQARTRGCTWTGSYRCARRASLSSPSPSMRGPASRPTRAAQWVSWCVGRMRSGI